MEVELKFRASPRDLPALERAVSHLGTVIHRPWTKHLVTRYFDSCDLALVKRGVALRLRRDGKRYIQGIKARRDAGDGQRSTISAAREEWEWPVKTADIDFRPLNAPPVADLMPPHAAASLQPVFETDIHRSELELRPGETTRVKVAFDRGKIIAGSRTAPVSEIELELANKDKKEGRASALYCLGLALQRTAPIAIETVSKGDRGYQLLGKKKIEPAKPPPVTLEKGRAVAEGFRLILGNSMSHLLANQAAALAEAEIDGVHQMRVAARRLRSALRLFHRVAISPEIRWLDSEIKWLGQELGHARDWDVFAINTLNLAKTTEAASHAVAAIAKPAAHSRQAAHAAVRHVIESPRYTTLVLTLGVCIDEDCWRDNRDPDIRQLLEQPLSEVAPDWLTRLAHKAQKAGRHIGNANPKERHKLRKSLKRLRYASHFLSSLYPHKRVERYLDRLSELQDILGLLNDLATAQKFLIEVSRGGHRSEASLVRTQLRDRERKALENLATAWRHFHKLKPY